MSHPVQQDSPAAEQPRGLGDTTVGLLTALIFLAPVFRGGNRGVALLALEWLALGIALALVSNALTGRLRSLPGSPPQQAAWWLVLMSPIWLPLLHWLAGEAALALPVARLHAALAGVPIAVCLCAALLSNDRQALWLARTWLCVALIQAALGLAQLSGNENLFFGERSSEVVGTFASRNTYANLLVMAVPLALREWLSALPKGGLGPWAWGVGLFALIVVVLLTQSRAGIATGMLVLLFAAALLPSLQATGWRRWWPMGLAATLLITALAVGGLEWATRFESDRFASDYAFRALLRDAALQGAIHYLPWGSGLGSFQWVSSTFQHPEAGRYWINLAHNDYLQWLMETGVPGAVLLLAMAVLYVGRSWELLSSGNQATGQTQLGLQRLALASGVGFLAFALHAMVDYPAHIPANAMLAATLVGLM
ncbi:MAG: O-antigen ligase family protein, partial [Hydrogenophaga sp.]